MLMSMVMQFSIFTSIVDNISLQFNGSKIAKITEDHICSDLLSAAFTFCYCV